MINRTLRIDRLGSRGMLLLTAAFACLAVLSVTAGCVGGGTSGTGVVRMEGVLVDQKGKPISRALVSDSITEQSARTNDQGQFFMETTLSSVLSFEVEGQLKALVPLLDAIPQNAAEVMVAFRFDRTTNQCEIIGVEVIATPAPQPTSRPQPTGAQTPGSPPSGAPPSQPTQAATPAATGAPTEAPASPTGQAPSSKPTEAAPPTATGAVSASPQPTQAPGGTEPPRPTQVPSATATAVRPNYAKGDLNCDGLIDMCDINPFTMALEQPLEYATAYPSCYRDLADMDNNGEYDSADATRFALLLQQLNPPPRSPCP
jgi:hypothetical protein